MTDRTPDAYRRLPAILLLLGLAPAATASGEPAAEQWLQWGGGPERTFQSPARGLATSWPEDGPTELWRRELGDGYSSIVVDGDRLYTMARRGDNDVVVALEAATGKTVWETEYPAPVTEKFFRGFGPGPSSTPAIAGGRLFAIGAFMHFHALDKATGQVLWAHDLMAEMGLKHPNRGYAASPLIWEDLVILALGGEGTAVVAFRQDDGTVVWKSQSFPVTYSSPLVAKVGGEEQVVVAMGADRAGLDPRTGELRWSVHLADSAVTQLSTQLWGEDNLLFASQAYSDGTRVIQVTEEDGKYAADELWYSRKMRVHHGTVVRLGDWVYGSSGDFGPAFLMAIHVKTGKVGFRQRGFAKANLLSADGKLIILDENGDLALGTPSPEGIEILCRAHVLETTSWTVPTLVGTRLYARDRQEIAAWDLGS